MITRILHVFTDAATSRRGKYIIIGGWLLLAVSLRLLAPNIATLYDNNANQRIPAEADSQHALALLQQKFPKSIGIPAIVVFYDTAGLTVDDRIRMHQFNNWLVSDDRPTAVTGVLSSFTVPQVANQLIAQDGTTMMMVVTLKGSSTEAGFMQSVKDIRNRVQNITSQSPLQANVTGPAGIATDLLNVFGSIDIKVLLATVALVFVLLIVLYRSPLLALLPLIAIGIVNMVITGLLGISAYAGLSIAQMSASIATVLLFGAGTDYSIFIASRFREELMQTNEKHQAMQQTMRAVGEAIASSAGIVILAMGTLLFALLGLYSSLGLALAITIFVMLLAGLTLVPALILCFGRAAYWPFPPRYQAQPIRLRTRGFWSRLGGWTVKHRVAAVLVSGIFLLLLALGNIGSQLSLNDLTSIRVSSDSTQGYALLEQHFTAGTLAPTTILIQLHGATPDVYQHLAQIDAITAALRKLPGVSSVRGPTRPDGILLTLRPTVLQAQITALPVSIRNAIRTGKSLPTCTKPSCQQFSTQQVVTISIYAAGSQYVSSDATTMQLSVALQNDPYSLTAIEQIAHLRTALSAALSANGLGQEAATNATFHLAGQTSQLADTFAYNERDALVIIPTVLVLVFLILALLLRSLVAPLYLLFAVTLNFLAAIGICGFFFQRVQRQEFYYAIPLYTFIFLIALGADYTIFLMSRVREETQQHGIEVGVSLAVAKTGGVITSAGLILAGTFLVLTALPLTLLYQLGICVAVGILLDTFIVRGLLIPGLVLLLGRWNWWPGRLKGKTSEGKNVGELASQTSIGTTL